MVVALARAAALVAVLITSAGALRKRKLRNKEETKGVDRHHEECWNAPPPWRRCRDDGSSICGWCGLHNSAPMYCCNKDWSYPPGHNCYRAVFSPSDEHRCVNHVPCPSPKKENSLQPGDIGEVDWLYTFGAPGCASPALQHQNNQDGVFPGLRTWQQLNGWVDIATSITGKIWLWHPYMKAEAIEMALASKSYEATEQTTRLPSSNWLSVALHLQPGYMSVTNERNCVVWTKYSDMSNNISYVQDVDEAKRLTEAYGWGIFGAAYYDGRASIIGGVQRSYLVQQPDSLECVLTFQGTQSTPDWYGNLAMRPCAFCGLVEEDEECGLFGYDTCKVRNPRGSFVHWGFAQHLRRMVHVDEWQQSIRAQLGKCSAVYVTGHSLGGAAASLFSACVSKRLQPGDFGFEDYDMMHWVKEKSAALNPMAVSLPN